MSTQAVALGLAALAGHGVFWVGLVNRVHGLGWPRLIVDSLTWLSVAAFFLLPVVLTGGELPAGPPRLLGPLSWATAYGLFCLVVLALYSAARVASVVHPERRGVVISEKEIPLRVSATPGQLLLPGPAFGLARLPGNQVLDARLTERELLIPQLPRELDGLRVAHLTDLHMSGRVGKAYFQAVIDRTLDEAPDLIALTGDLVEYDAQHAWLGDTLLRLAAPEGVYFVLGNHDDKHDHDAMIAQMAAAGHVYLGGRTVERRIRGRRCAVVGNELPWFRPAGAPPRDPPADFTLCLAHGPDQFRWAQRRRVDLVLAGHNHGGQVRVPLLGAVVTPSVHGTRYNGGVFRRGRTVMHVSRGVGSLAPVRYCCPPEFSVLKLRSARPANAG